MCVEPANEPFKLVADSPEKGMLSLMQNIAWAEGIDVAKLSSDPLPEATYRMWGSKPT